MELPLELEAAEVDQAVAALHVDGPVEELAEGNQVLERGAGLLAVVEKGEVADELGAFQRHWRAGMEFFVEGLALCVLGEVDGQGHGAMRQGWSGGYLAVMAARLARGGGARALRRGAGYFRSRHHMSFQFKSPDHRHS